MDLSLQIKDLNKEHSSSMINKPQHDLNPCRLLNKRNELVWYWSCHLWKKISINRVRDLIMGLHKYLLFGSWLHHYFSNFSSTRKINSHLLGHPKLTSFGLRFKYTELSSMSRGSCLVSLHQTYVSLTYPNTYIHIYMIQYKFDPG